LNPRQIIERYENKILAPYAARSSETRGRVYSQEKHPLRTEFQRDRDRVIHSAAFRRMELKTQVFFSDEGDHYRTRLTHTLEVAQISRTIARALGLNEDLSEAIALVHDLGHTPFGHAGEWVMDELLADFGGFNHNRQSLRIVDLLEKRYERHPGLNLTYEVREGIVKHESGTEPFAPKEFPPDEKPTLEALLVDLADAVAYNCHDLDDGLSSGILNWDDLYRVPILDTVLGRINKEHPDSDTHIRRHIFVRRMVDIQVSDLIETSFSAIGRLNLNSLDEVRHAEDRAIAFSEEMTQKLHILKSFLTEKMYRHPRMMDNAERSRRVIEKLFESYCSDPGKLYGRFKDRLEKEPVEIVVADFIAGMTDRFALRMYDRISS